MNLGYSWQKFHQMVYGLVTSTTPMQQRLIECYRGSLVVLRDEDLPEDLLKDWKAISDALGDIAKTDGAGGTFKDVVRMMGELEAIQLAENIVSLYDQIAQRYGAEKSKQEGGDA
jgi:hypothetical protein